MGQQAVSTDMCRARTAHHRHHQLSSSGFGVLNGFGFAVFLGLGRRLGFVGPGMGNGVGLRLRLHPASPTTSLTRIRDFP